MGAQSPLTSSLLTPMLALIVWSLAMLAWTAVRRPAQARDEAPLTSQSTLFYALIAYSYLAGQQNGPNLILAWAYVALRAVHGRRAGAGGAGGAGCLGAVLIQEPFLFGENGASCGARVADGGPAAGVVPHCHAPTAA
jgi:hypothetical protein